jgi:O-antigen/teichoic acid export membrane protein
MSKFNLFIEEDQVALPLRVKLIRMLAGLAYLCLAFLLCLLTFGFIFQETTASSYLIFKLVTSSLFSIGSLIISYRLLTGKKRKDNGVVGPVMLIIFSFILIVLGIGMLVIGEFSKAIGGSVIFILLGIAGVLLAINRIKTHNKSLKHGTPPVGGAP